MARIEPALAIRNAEAAFNTLRRECHKSLLQSYSGVFTYHAALVNHVNNLESYSREFPYVASLGNNLERVEDVLERKNIIAEIIRREHVVLVSSEHDVFLVADLRKNAPDWQVSLFIYGELPQDVRDRIEEMANSVGINVTSINPFPWDIAVVSKDD